MDSATSAFPGRAHSVIRIEVVAGTIAVAVEGSVIAFPNPLVNCPVKLAPQLDLVNARQPSARYRFRRGDLARLELVVWIKSGLEFLHSWIKFAKVIRHIQNGRASCRERVCQYV